MKVFIPFHGDSVAEYAPLEQLGHKVVFGRPKGDRKPYTDDELASLCRDVDGVIAYGLPGAAMVQASKLRAVIAPIIGIDRVDLETATQNSIIVCNSPAAENFKGVAESVVGFIFMLGHRQKHKEALLRAGRWSTEADRGQLLMGKSVGFVGFGRTASAVAQHLQAWQMRLVAYDPYVSPASAAKLGVAMVDSLEKLLRESDYISLHPVVTDETRNMIGERELRMMKPTAYLINISRGQILDETAFCRAVNEAWIAGGALDVYQQEPLPIDSPLRELDPVRVILTPHNITQSPDSGAGGRRIAVENMIKALAGEVPQHVMNPEVIESWVQRFGHA